MKPRNLFYHALFAFHTVLLLLVAGLSWYDNRRATRDTRATLAAYSRRLDDVQKQVDSSLSGSPRVGQFREKSGTQVDSSLSGPPRVGQSRDKWVRRPPVFVGSGRSGSWAYVDVLYGDGAVRRHFVRASSSPSDVKAFVRSLAFEASQHSWILADDDDGDG